MTGPRAACGMAPERHRPADAGADGPQGSLGRSIHRIEPGAAGLSDWNLGALSESAGRATAGTKPVSVLCWKRPVHPSQAAAKTI